MTSPLTDQQLDGYAALANAATPGPWHLTDSDAIVAPLTQQHVADVWEPTAASRNGEFVEAARDALPALVDEVRRLRAQLEDQADAEFVGQSAGTFTGTRPCGHDDYHDPHEWADRPGVWCPGISYADDEEK